jgi:hypothetical protein
MADAVVPGACDVLDGHRTKRCSHRQVGSCIKPETPSDPHLENEETRQRGSDRSSGDIGRRHQSDGI